jgi:hypothetical protein
MMWKTKDTEGVTKMENERFPRWKIMVILAGVISSIIVLMCVLNILVAHMDVPPKGTYITFECGKYVFRQELPNDSEFLGLVQDGGVKAVNVSIEKYDDFALLRVSIMGHKQKVVVVTLKEAKDIEKGLTKAYPKGSSDCKDQKVD